MKYEYENITNQQAAEWYARLQSPNASAEDSFAFKQWLELSEENRKAYQAVLSTVNLVDSQLQQDPRLKALADAALSESKQKKNHRGITFGFFGLENFGFRSSTFAVLALVISLCVLFKGMHNKELAGYATEYVNNERHEQIYELADGSVIHLDVASRIFVRLSTSERKLELTRGRAFFDVAHDKFRPFVVTASGTQVVALGTRFQVEVEQGEKINVVLVEGSVAVTDAKNDSNWREVLVPGQELVVDRFSQRKDKRNVDARSLTSWSSRRLVFNDTPLHEVLEEINRYSTVKIVLGDATLSDLLVGGNFVAGGDSQEFVDTLLTALPLRSEYTGANEIVLFQRYKNSPYSY